MNTTHQQAHSHLFTIHVWEEEIETEQSEWRGRVQLLSSGEVRYFREWMALVPLLRTMLAELAVEQEPQQ